MTVTGFRPLRDFMSLREAMNQLFEDSVVGPGHWLTWTSAGTRYLPLDIYETADDIVVRAMVPGVTPDNLDVQYHQGVLTLRARSAAPETNDSYRWHVREIGFGETVRQIQLPREIDVDSARASFDNGLLTLTLPKTPQAKVKQIKIESAPQITAGTPGTTAN
jgi:HSP20 family protein